MLDWNKYIEVAERFQGKVIYQDREDTKHDIILRLAEVEVKRNGNGGHLTEAGMIRTASFVIREYWHDLKRKPTIQSLNHASGDGGEDGDGETPELWQTLADDKVVDLDAWLDINTWLLGCPKRLVEIAQKRVNGEVLDTKDKMYLGRFRTKAKQMLLFDSLLELY